MRAIFSKHIIAVVICVMGIVCHRADAAEKVTIRGLELAAASVAMEHFKTIYAKPNLKHYEVLLTRSGKELKVQFVPDQPTSYPPGTAGTGGGSRHGPEMTYFVSIHRLKILRFNFHR